MITQQSQGQVVLMSGPVGGMFTHIGVVVPGTCALGPTIVPAARDSDWWPVLRGVVRGRYERHRLDRTP